MEKGSILGHFLCPKGGTSWIFVAPKRRHIFKLGKRPRKSGLLVLRKCSRGSAGSEDVKQETPTYKVPKRSLTLKIEQFRSGHKKVLNLQGSP